MPLLSRRFEPRECQDGVAGIAAERRLEKNDRNINEGSYSVPTTTTTVFAKNKKRNVGCRSENNIASGRRPLFDVKMILAAHLDCPNAARSISWCFDITNVTIAW